MKWCHWWLFVFIFLITACSNLKKVGSEKNRHFRASWVASVINLDWPSKTSTEIFSEQERILVQKKELIQILEQAVKMRMNAIVLQVKPEADALYASDILPWSSYLTGTLGKNPGYDPLAFAVQEAHKRNLELHAWINPYRVSMNTEKNTVDQLNRPLPDRKKSVYKSHPEWIRIAHDRFVLDPGIPEVRDWIKNFIKEMVTRYDIDAVHLDDYFYYETPRSKLNDDQTYLKYGKMFNNKADWRRNNTYLLIKSLSEEIHQ
ncbi:glycoside hydrolase family 10 protein, partial [Candidatus Williamhamiltonella defendens]